MKKWLFFSFFSFGNFLYAQTSLPLLTGPLIAPLGIAVPYGDFVIRSYLYCTADTGIYDGHWHSISANENFYSFNNQYQCFFGLTPWCDINITPQFFLNTTSNQYSLYPGDLTVGLDFQLMAADLTPYFPGIKFAVREVFPIGNFQQFSPRKRFTDQTGNGTFATQLDLVLYKIFPLQGPHWLSLTCSAQYTINTPVHVLGFNSYGGGFGTTGQVIPGNSFQGIVSFEATLSKHWALSLDNVYVHKNTSPFFGTPGITLDGTLAQVGSKSSDQFSLAPAIEYNFNHHFGIIAGCWFSALGRNSAEFRGGVVNFEYVY